MSQVGWLCVFSGEKKTFEECITCSKSPQHCEFTPEMLVLMRKNMWGKRKNPNRPSVTQLTKDCLRQIVIQDRNDYWVSPRKNWYAFRGTLIHQVLEGSMPSDGWKEVYYSRELELSDGRTIRIASKVDKVLLDKLLIRDYKTTRRLPTKKTGAYGKHELQLNIYRWIWWPIFHADKLRLQYIDMTGTKQVKVPLMDIEEVEEFLKQRALAYAIALESPDVPPKEYNSKNWECRYCDVQDICRQLNEED